MQIIGASIQKTGEFFLHAGYLSSPMTQVVTSDSLDLIAGGTFLVGIYFLINFLLEKPKFKFFAYVLVIFLLYWALGCAIPHGAG